MNIFTRMSSLLQQLREGGRHDPMRDWLLLLTLSTITLASIIVWNVWAFDTVANGGVIGTSVPKAPPAFNQASLDAIHTIFTSREAEEKKYETGVYRFVDPSQQ